MVQQTGLEERRYWVNLMVKIVGPVLTAMAERRLKATMPVEGVGDARYDRRNFSHLEALGRSLLGLAPWLECPLKPGPEAELRRTFAGLARLAIDAATDPESPDFVNFSFSFQPIVDGAFLAHAILRAPNELWLKLEERVRRNLIKGLYTTRSRKPHFNNWLLFSTMIEAALFKMGADWDPMRVDYGLRQHEQWYLGDGCYGDGPQFHWDYYNSYVIQPMLVDIIQTVGDQYPEWAELKPEILKRAQRYAAILEKMISPEGTIPVTGRSITYRCGALHHLAQMALEHNLPQELAPAQVRSALAAVIRRMMEMPGTFDQNGWLKIGFCGSQPRLGERYISTGSLYLCTAGLLPLGLPPEDEFWADKAQDWSARKIWSGQDVTIDHALDHEPI